MASKVGICNIALNRLGTTPILSIDDNVKKAIVLKGIYDEIRDIVLVDHTWNFAIKRAILAEVSPSPAWGYGHSFSIPPDSLRILGLCNNSYGDNDIDPTLTFKVEGDVLVTDNSSAYIKYIAKITTEGRFSVGFAFAFSARLAAESCKSITGDQNLAEALMQKYLDLDLPKAKAMDSQEGTPETYETNEWIDARI